MGENVVYMRAVSNWAILSLRMELSFDALFWYASADKSKTQRPYKCVYSAQY